MFSVLIFTLSLSKCCPVACRIAPQSCWTIHQLTCLAHGSLTMIVTIAFICRVDVAPKVIRYDSCCFFVSCLKCYRFLWMDGLGLGVPCFWCFGYFSCSLAWVISHGVSCVVWVINDSFGEQDAGLCSHLVYDMLGYARVFVNRMLGCARTWYMTCWAVLACLWM